MIAVPTREPNVIGRFIDVNPSIWWPTVVINKELQI